MMAGIILLTVGAAATYLFTVSSSTVKTLKTTYTDVGKGNTAKTIKATKPLTILLMGVDTGGEGRGTATSWNGNSDSQIVMTLNPETDTTTMVSMERDTMTNILNADGNVAYPGEPQKMNAAYPMGYNAGGKSKGLETAVAYSMKTISEQSGINIDNFVTMNFDGLINLVDAVGGIDVNNDSGKTLYIYNTEPEYTATVPPGEQHINGEQALVFARDRDHLPNGDYGRAAHQREVLSALMKKILALDNITQYQKFLNEASKDFRTNIPITTSTLTSLLGYKDCFKKVVSVQYQGIGSMVNGVSYQFMPTNIYLAVQNAMLKSLGQPTITSINNNIITYESYFGADTTSTYYLPSATVTANGKVITYGIDTSGNFVKVNSANSGTYVSANGGSVGASDADTNSSTSASSTQTTTDTGTGDGTSSDYGSSSTYDNSNSTDTNSYSSYGTGTDTTTQDGTYTGQ